MEKKEKIENKREKITCPFSRITPLTLIHSGFVEFSMIRSPTDPSITVRFGVPQMISYKSKINIEKNLSDFNAWKTYRIY